MSAIMEGVNVNFPLEKLKILNLNVCLTLTVPVSLKQLSCKALVARCLEKKASHSPLIPMPVTK